MENEGDGRPRRPQVARRFEDLVAWERARELAAATNALASGTGVGRDRALAWQLKRAAGSAMANIAEGFERGSPAEFARFLLIARGSCAEVKSYLYEALDAGLVTQAEFDSHYALVASTSQLIVKLHQAVARRAADRRR